MTALTTIYDKTTSSNCIFTKHPMDFNILSVIRDHYCCFFAVPSSHLTSISPPINDLLVDRVHEHSGPVAVEVGVDTRQVPREEVLDVFGELDWPIASRESYTFHYISILSLPGTSTT
jgi:hypothetical protein